MSTLLLCLFPRGKKLGLELGGSGGGGKSRKKMDQGKAIEEIVDLRQIHTSRGYFQLTHANRRDLAHTCEDVGGKVEHPQICYQGCRR